MISKLACAVTFLPHICAASPLRRMHPLAAEGFAKRFDMLFLSEHENLEVVVLVSDGVPVP